MGLKEEVKIILGLEGTAQVEQGLDRVSRKFSTANQQIDRSTRGALALGNVIGRTVVPELNSVASIGVSAFGELGHVAKLAGTSIASIGIGAAAIAGEVWLLRNAWTEMVKAIEAEKKATDEKWEAHHNLVAKLREELALLRALGHITEAEHTAAWGTMSGEQDTDRMRMMLRSFQTRAGLAPVSPFDAAKSRAEMELLEGEAKQLAIIESRYQAQLKENGELFKRQGLYDSQLQLLNQLAEQNRDQEISALRFKAAAETNKELAAERLRLQKEQSDEAEREARAAEEAAQAAKDALRAKERQLAIASMLAAQVDAGVVRDESLPWNQRRQAMVNEANRELGDNLSLTAEIQDEEARNRAIEDAREVHAQRMRQIELASVNAERAIRDRRVQDAASMFGAMADLAKVFGRKGFIAYQVTAIAEAIIATYLGASKALADGDSYSAIFRSAAIIAAGVANVAQIASQSPGYEIGGYTGDGPINGVAGVVHGREFVFSAPATAAIGRGNLEAMHDAATSGRGAGRPQDVRVLVFDDRRKMRDLEHDPEFRNIVVNIAQGEKWRIG